MKRWKTSATILGSAAVVVWLARIRRDVLRVRVAGKSMEPTLRHGDEVLARRVAPALVNAGDVVIVSGPQMTPQLTYAYERDTLAPADSISWDPSAHGARSTFPPMIKRVTAIAGENVPACVSARMAIERVPAGTVLLLGDNPDASLDSRHFGCVPADRILGRVIHHIRTEPRAHPTLHP
jgi:signal peptidase I